MSITLIIVIVTCTISILCFNDRKWFENLKHFPIIEKRNHEYYRWLTSGFVHGDYLHLGVNMFVFHEFGRSVENNFIFHFGDVHGQALFLLTYLLIIIMGDIPTYFKHQDNSTFASVGASGGVSGILFIYILLYPWAMLGLFAIIPIPAIVFGIFYLWYSTWASQNQNDNIDHEAHFYGAVAGILIAIVSRPALGSEFVQSLISDFPL